MTMGPENPILVNWYKVNKKSCTIIVLHQGKSHRLDLLSKTKSDDYLNILAWEFINRQRKPIRFLNQVM